MTGQRKQALAAFAAGALFAVGLTVGGMTKPSKVIGFLDVTGDWDPSLAFVMGGAIAVFLPLFRWVTRRDVPMCATRFSLPTRRDIDKPLLLGAALFGSGWGLAGYCPGPAFTSLGSFAPESLLFTVAMLGGFGLKRGYDYMRSRGALPQTASPAYSPIGSVDSEAGQPAWSTP
jgi:uncharacterized membrane protein YedE/YeeE